MVEKTNPVIANIAFIAPSGLFNMLLIPVGLNNTTHLYLITIDKALCCYLTFDLTSICTDQRSWLKESYNTNIKQLKAIY